jgi:hypothetical protein
VIPVLKRYPHKEAQYRVRIKRRLRINGINFPSLNTLETESLEALDSKLSDKNRERFLKEV